MRVTTPDAVPALRQRLPAWLAAGHHGEMEWMVERADQRADPAILWPGVRSIVMLGMNYGPEADPLALLALKDRGAIAAYAQRRDYHDVVKGKLKELGGYLSAKGDVRVKVFVDTAPVMEKPLAAASGLGWQGKHTVLISREHGNWLLLGAIYTSADLVPDSAESDHCGSCRRCLDICPTAAFPTPRTNSMRGAASPTSPSSTKGRSRPNSARPSATASSVATIASPSAPGTSSPPPPRRRASARGPTSLRLPLAELARLDDAAFRARFAGTPVKRTGRDRFLRNVLIAIGNSNDPALAPEAERCLSDPSPLVRGMAVWASSRLTDAAAMRGLFNSHAIGETDAEVGAEWRAALDHAGNRSA